MSDRIQCPELSARDAGDLQGAFGVGGSMHGIAAYLRDRDPRERPQFHEEFTGYALNEYVWQKIDTNSATEAMVANKNEFALTIAANDEAEDAGLSFGDQLSFDIDNLLGIQFRAKVTTPGTGVTAVMGLASATNATLDTIAANAWFRFEAGLSLLTESDDAASNVDDQDTGLDLTTATYYWFEIDCSTKAKIRYFVNGVEYNRSVKHTLAGYTAGLQPYFRLTKASGTGTGVITLDSVHVYEKDRS